MGTAVTAFTPLTSLVGGAMIGLAAVLLMGFQGRIAGVSGIAVRVFPPYLDDALAGRIAFVVGLVAAPLIYATFSGAWPVSTVAAGTGALVFGGVLVGFGSVWGSGCTSGHGVCGLARLSSRSFVAVAVFMMTAVITVYIARHVLGVL
jgi:uncharacterized protein